MIVCLCFLMLPNILRADEKKLNVVATQTIFADLVRQIGGDRVEVSAVASPRYNIHFIQPKPSDVRRVGRADLYVNSGLDLEAWSDPLLEAAGKPELFRGGARNVDVSRGIRLLGVPDHPVTRAEGDIHAFGNPHFHMDPENARIIARNILVRLQEVDPVNSDYYSQRAREFEARLDAKIDEWKILTADLDGKEVISYHEDILYFADFLGLKVKEYLEPKPGIPPSPKHLQFLKEYAAANHVHAIVMPTYYPKGAAEALAKRINGKVVTIAQGVGEVQGTDDFFSFFDYNFKQISEGVR